MGAAPGHRTVSPAPRARWSLRILRAARYLWVLPATAVGLIAATTALALGARAAVVDGVLEVSGGRLARAVLRLPRDLQFSAITLGHVILGLESHVLARVRAHEHAHVRQYERWGLLFFPLYACASLVAWLGCRNPYWHNHFECEARREAALEEAQERSADATGEAARRS